MTRLAFYDLDGTLCSSNVVVRYAFFARHHPSKARGRVPPPLIAEGEKVAAIERLCRQWNASLPESKAYSDSFSDAPMLESVGNPVAVNPDRRLKRVAQSRGWPILELKRSAGRGDGRWAVAALEGDHDGHPR